MWPKLLKSGFKRNCWSWFINYKNVSYKNMSISSLKTNFNAFVIHKKYVKIQVKFICATVILSNLTLAKQDVEDNVAHLLTLARIALERGDVDRAEAIIEMGLKICEDYKVYMAIPYIYDILTSIAFGQGNIEKAENLLVDVIEKMIQTGSPEDDHHVIDFKLRLARIYSNHKLDDLAEIGFKSCLDIQKAKIILGDFSTRTGMLYVNVLFWYAVHKIRNVHYHEAKQLLEIAYDYSQKIKGLSPYQEMVILYTLGDLNLELKQYDAALKHMLNAVLLGQGISSADLPRCYIKLAKIYVKLRSYDHAIISASEGLRLSKLFNNVEVQEEAKLILHQIKSIESNT